MNLSGETKFKQSKEDVWDALHDTDILIKAIPGCQSLTETAPGEYDVVMKLGVAAVKGEYLGEVKIVDLDKPNHYQLFAKGSGSPGFVNATMDCKLEETEKGSKLIWSCDAEVGGMIAGVGNRVLGGIAKYLAGQFFKIVEKQMKVTN